MRCQNIQTPDCVPKLHSGNGVADQEHLASGYGVLVVGRLKARVHAGRIGIVDALPLAHRIERKDDVAELHQSLAASLIGVGGLAVWRVAHLKQNAGKGRRASGGYVNVRRDVKLGTALVNNLLNAIAGPVK